MVIYIITGQQKNYVSSRQECYDLVEHYIALLGPNWILWTIMELIVRLELIQTYSLLRTRNAWIIK